VKKKLVECDHCGEVSFWTCKEADKFHGYRCFECQESDWEDFVYSVAGAGMTVQKLTIKDWRYLDRRLKKQVIYKEQADGE